MNARKLSSLLLAVPLLGCSPTGEPDDRRSPAVDPAGQGPVVGEVAPGPAGGDALYLIGGAEGSERAYRLDARGWQPLTDPPGLSLDDEPLVDDHLYRDLDGHLYLLTRGHVLTLAAADAALRVFAPLPQTPTGQASPLAFAAGPGVMWVLLEEPGGQRLFARRGQQWSPLPISRVGQPLAELAVDRGGRLWARSQNSLYRAVDSGVLREVDVGKLEQSIVHGIVAHPAGVGPAVVSVVGESALLHFDDDGEVLERIGLDDLRLEKLRLADDGAGRLVVSAEDCMFRLFATAGEVDGRQRTLPYCHWLGSVAIDERQGFWLDTDAGLVAIDPRGQVVARYGRPDIVGAMVTTGTGPLLAADAPLLQPGPTGTLAIETAAVPAPPEPAADTDAKLMRASTLVRVDNGHRRDGRLTMPPVLPPPQSPPPVPAPTPISAVLAITADVDPSDTNLSPDRVTHRTWVQRAGAQAPEIRKGLYVAEGQDLWQLRVVVQAIDLPLCPCGDDGPVDSGRQIQVTQTVIEARRDGSDDWQRLLDDYPKRCVPSAADFGFDHEIVAVAGAQVFVLRDFAGHDCGLHGERRRDAIVVTPSGQTSPAEELLAGLKARDRELGLRALSLELEADVEQLHLEAAQEYGWWPHHLYFLALYPDYHARKPAVTLVYGIEVAYTSAFNWSDYRYAATGQVPLTEISALYPPPDAEALLTKVRAQAKPVGWSRQSGP